MKSSAFFNKFYHTTSCLQQKLDNHVTKNRIKLENNCRYKLVKMSEPNMNLLGKNQINEIILQTRSLSVGFSYYLQYLG